MKKLIILFALLSLLAAALPASAQGEFVIESDAEPLDAGPIMEAAQPLMDRGAIVAIYFVQSGERDEFNNRLRDDDLMRGDNLEDNLIAIFVSLDDRYSEIAYGARWVDILRPRAEGIKSSALDGNLREGAYTLAYARALEELDAVIGGTYVPPVSTVPSRRITPEESRDSSFNWMILIWFAFLAYGIFRRIRRWVGFDDSPGPISAPRYKSNWSSGHRPSSGRSSISRSSSRSSSRSHSSRGGRSGGRW
jgi:uncharacterized membrane protein YgcG